MLYHVQVIKKYKYWYWRIKRAGEILCHSEGYSSLDKARQTAQELTNNFTHGAAVYEEIDFKRKKHGKNLHT